MTTSSPAVSIRVSLSSRTLVLSQSQGDSVAELLKADIVSGCDDSGTPAGAYIAGDWVKDKTNPKHGPIPWSRDNWKNPYGPYFLPLNDAKTGKYTTYGIHGTRGPIIGGFEKPPIPQALVRLFVGEEEAKYLYCSHGCIRLSNARITELYALTTNPK
jgi:lipoprotein-anchoring transpeptidase ErfK/SrfK